MPIPSHSIDCFSKTFRTKCPDCEGEVFFFSCSCGSKVFFDDLGWPWNQHRCKKYAVKEAIDMIRDFERFTDNEIYQVIEEYKKRHSLEISDDIWDMLEYELGKRTHSFKYTEIECSTDVDIITGQVMQINRSVNFYKKFHLDKKSPLSKGLLGVLADLEFDEITIRENPDKNNHSKQYKAFIEHSIAKINGLKKSDKVLAPVSVVSIPSGTIWKITDINIY